MSNNSYHLGIDTSNYTTSLAVCNDNFDIVFDQRIPLKVKDGHKGLRQSEAIYQHMRNMPVLAEALFGSLDRGGIISAGISSRPRPVEGSYMPVFNAGVDYGKVICYALGIPFRFYSHQEGHLEAVRRNSPLADRDEFIAFHLSGGTCEILRTLHKDNKYDITLIGGSKDISFGQLIDRIGVAMGLPFPSGAMMDKMALEIRQDVKPMLKKISIDGSYFNLSGVENQCIKLMESGCGEQFIAHALFSIIGTTLCEVIQNVVKTTGINSVMLAGGVASSAFIRNVINGCFKETGILTVFGDKSLSSDNAVGISFLSASEHLASVSQE